MIWETAHAVWPTGSVFRYFARHPEGKVFGCSIASPAMLDQSVAWAEDNGYNSYWQPNPTRKRHGTRCSIADITDWSFLTLDFDPGECAPTLDAITALLPPQLAGRSYLGIHSGRGIQLLFPVTGFPLSDASRFRIAATISHWVTAWAAHYKGSGFHLDTSCSDLPRVMRLPGTTNQKTHTRAHVLHPLPGQWWATNEGLATELVVSVPEHALRSATPTPVMELNWTAYLPRTTRTARRFLAEGAEEPGRHKAAAAAMLSLWENGASKEQCLQALLYGAALSIPPLPEIEVAQMVERKYRHVLDISH